MALPTGGYSYTPQTANLGASPLSALKPLDVGVSVSFTPMPKYEVPSAQEELVSMGAAKGFQALTEPVFAAIKAKDDEAKEADKEALKFERDKALAKIRAEKTPEELLYEKARLADLLSRTEERGGGKVPVRSRPKGAFKEKEVRKAIPADQNPIVIPSVNNSDNSDLPQTPTDPTSIDDPRQILAPLSSVDEQLPMPDLSRFNRGGVLADISFQQPSAIATAPFEPVISQEQIAAVRNPPLANMQAATGGVMVPPVPVPEPEVRTAIPVTPTPTVLPATAVTTQPSSFKSNPAMLAKLEENRVKMIKEATIADEALQNKARVAEEIGNLTEKPYESPEDAWIAATRIQELLPNYNPPKITRETDKELGTTVFYVEQPEINDKYVAPGTAPEMSETQIKVWNTLSDKVQQNPLIKNAIDAESSFQIVASSLDENNGFGDIAAINAFQRMVDPGVAVREGDVALLQTAIPRLKRLGLTVTNLVEGDRLTQEARDEIKKLANALAKTRINLGKQSILDLRKTAKLNKIDPDLVIREFSIAPSKSELTKEIDVLEAKMRGIPKSQSNDPAAIEMINKRNSLKMQLQQAK